MDTQPGVTQGGKKNQRIAERGVIDGRANAFDATGRSNVFSHARRVSFDACRGLSSRNGSSSPNATGRIRRWTPPSATESQAGRERRIRESKGRKTGRNSQSKRKARLGKEETERNVMQSGKPCRSPFVKGHASY